MKQLLQLTQLLKTKLELVRTNKFNFNNFPPYLILGKITLEFQMQTIRVGRVAWRMVGSDERKVSSGRFSFVGVSSRVPIEIVPSTRSSSHRYKDLYSQL